MLAVQSEQPDGADVGGGYAASFDYAVSPDLVCHRPVVRAFYGKKGAFRGRDRCPSQCLAVTFHDQMFCGTGTETGCRDGKRSTSSVDTRLPHAVLAVEAGQYLLRHLDEYRMEVPALLAERKRVAEALEATGGVEVLPSDTHYFLARLRRGSASDLKAYLAERHGLLIRDASNFEGLDTRYFRIAIQTEEENNLLIEGIREWIRG